MKDFLIAVPITIVLANVGLFLIKKYRYHKALGRLAELDDCPFEYSVAWNDSDDYIIFDFGGGLTLWCEYEFGIRSDGVYGVDRLKLKGLNGSRGGVITLKIGQSVFPLIEKMNEFQVWASKKAFTCVWEMNFEDAWGDMKKKIDNLRFLETKSLEKEKRKK